jgi:hypothetical protein
MASPSDELVNIGTGEDITIAEFARVVVATVGYGGEISFDHSRARRHAAQIARCQTPRQIGLARAHLAQGWNSVDLSGLSQRIETGTE